MTDNQESAQQFAVQRIYIKDLSYESPMGTEVFTQQWKPKMHVDLNTKAKSLADDMHEVTLSITVTAKLEDKAAMLIEVQQAGVFLVKGIEGEQQKRVLGIMAPNLLFPYAREVLDSLALKGGFPALGLQPVNFEALYMQAMEASKTEAAH